MNERIIECMYEWMNIWMNEWLNEWMNKRVPEVLAGGVELEEDEGEGEVLPQGHGVGYSRYVKSTVGFRLRYGHWTQIGYA